MVPEETGGCDNRILDGEEDLLAACVTPTLIAGDKGEEAIPNFLRRLEVEEVDKGILDLVPEETGGCDNRVMDGEEDLLAACVTPTLIEGDKGEEACKGNLLLATGEAMNNQLHSVL